jgi:hypothetical protein
MVVIEYQIHREIASFLVVSGGSYRYSNLQAGQYRNGLTTP